MRRTFLPFLFGIIFLSSVAHAQWQTQESGTAADLRGLSVVSREVAWASGSRGTYVRTIDGGVAWQPAVVAGAEKLDFRDVHAIDANTAYLLSAGAGESSRIYKTSDGGGHWTLQYTSRNPQAFFDALAFWDPNHGIALSDPDGGHFLIIMTADGGATWKEVPRESIPPALTGEAAFAASGTCLVVEGKNRVWFGTGGGSQARVFLSTDRGRTWKVSATPIVAGNSSSGIFSLAFRDAKHGIAVGGDYKKPENAKDNVAITADGGQTWRLIKGSPPGGFRSCVACIPGTGGRSMVVVGPSGSDYSADGGDNWTSVGKEGYNTIGFAKAETAGWAIGPKGRIAKYQR